MKSKFTIILIAILLPIFTLAQNHQVMSKKDNIDYISPYRDLRAIPCNRHIHYFLNYEGQMRYQGEYTIQGDDNLKGSYRNDQQHYKETRTYDNGILNGKFSQTYNHNGNGTYGNYYTVSHHWSTSGYFNDGLPDGVWKFTLNSRLRSSGENSNTQRTETAVYENGRLKTLTDRQGRKLTFDDYGLISGQGQLKDGNNVNLQHSIICNTYQNRVGDILKIGPEQQQILDEIIEQHCQHNIFELTDRGYAVDWQEAFLSQFTRYAEHMDRYVQIDNIAPNFPMPAYSVRLGYLKQVQKVNDDEAVEYYIQRQEEFKELMRNGYFIKWHAKRYFGASAAIKIQNIWLNNQKEMLTRKLNLISNITTYAPWSTTLEECSRGENSLTDLFALQWSRNDLSNEEAYREITSVINEKLGSLYPIVGFEINHVEYAPDAIMNTQCTIHRGMSDSIGYESIKLELSTNNEGYILLNRMQPENYQRIANTWDTIYVLEDSLRQQQLEIRKSLYSNDNKSFKHYCDSVMADKTIIPEVRLSDLRTLQQLQNETAENAPLLKEIQELHSSLLAHLHQYRYISKLYVTYFNEIDPSWDCHIENLQELLNAQKTIFNSKRHSELPTFERKLKHSRAKTIDQLLELL